MDRQEFLVLAQLEGDVLEAWVAAGWLVPRPADGAHEFSAIDVARAHLIKDLSVRAGVNEAGIDVVLHLMDQLHGLRRTMAECLAAMRAQPTSLRQQLADELQRALTGEPPAPRT